ncbi:topoisomerase 6 subunit A, putative [Ixodes scapularis]|uniref:Topoisomerase 6 subunit A, putative n=1 Tax=Ixodes scapularis TaxID=6945 RepID=B7QAT2_IXOSC|nr:topoisomerase 6 subunit A, putative [Ixodes scapularis]|eukprot:XP_002412658.1 topoisomerase 6 subunit A, putative [Ixodes scapularis]
MYGLGRRGRLSLVARMLPRLLELLEEVFFCALVLVPRRCLNVLATSKGLFSGDVRFTDGSGNFVDGSFKPTLVPTDVGGMRNIQSSATFILVIEKDATFQKLLNDGFLKSAGPCILITGKGYPDVNTRELLRRLHVEVDIPVYALVDADPYGIEILCVYAYGSLAMANETDSMAVPRIRWLGVHPSDVVTFELKDCPPLSYGDKSKLRNLLARPYVDSKPAWKEQMVLLDGLQRKAEIQGLCSVDPTFLSDVYIPSKIKFSGWI